MDKEKGQWLSRNNASGVVAFSIFIHSVFLIVVGVKIKILNFDFRNIPFNKGIVAIVGVIMLALTFLYYSESRATKIGKKYEAQEPFEGFGGWIVACLIFIPLIFALILRSSI